MIHLLWHETCFNIASQQSIELIFSCVSGLNRQCRMKRKQLTWMERTAEIQKWHKMQPHNSNAGGSGVVFSEVHYGCEWLYTVCEFLLSWLLVWISIGAEESAGDPYSVCVCVCLLAVVYSSLFFKRSNIQPDVVRILSCTLKLTKKQNIIISQTLSPQRVSDYLWLSLREINFNLYCTILVYHHLFTYKASKCKAEFYVN